MVAVVGELDSRIESLLSAVENGQPSPPPVRKQEAEWRPGFVWNGSDGHVTTGPVPGEDKPDWSQVLSVFELDASEYDIVEPVLFNAWHGPSSDGPILYRQWKARVVRKHAAVASFDIDELIRSVKKDKPLKKVAPSGDGSFVVMCSDWQIGKSDGDGLDGTITRIVHAIDDVAERVRELRRIGRPLGRMFVLWSGDSVEGCVGHYEMQTSSVELNRRDQVKVARRLLRDALKSWSALFDEVVVVAVAGNHGENRNASGKAFTSLSDNDDLAIVEQVAEAFSENGERYGHVKFVIPDDSMSVTVEASGWILGLTHGHVAKSSGSPEQKLRRWYEQQAAGRQPIGSCDVLASGHYHNLAIRDWGATMWVQAPALDGGSDWWRHRTGDVSTAGVLTWAMYPGVRMADIHLLAYERPHGPS